MAKEKIYFGHPVNVYNTPLESELLEKIRMTFPGVEIINPNQKEHAEGYQRYKETCGNGMEYYSKEVLPACNAGIFLPFRDGKYGKGVHTEAESFSERRLPVFQITADGEISVISRIDFKQIVPLTVEETRARIRTETGAPKPY